MSARASRKQSAPSGTPSLAAGYLAALPLFLAYEVGVAGAPRSSAERVVGRILFLFEDRLQWARIALIVLCAALAWARLRSRSEGAEPWAGLRRLVLEGLLAGVVLGPVLFGLHAWLDPGPLPAAAARPGTLGACLQLIGTAPWEELLFRVGLYGGLFLLVRRAVLFLGLESRVAHLGAEWLALLLSALLFAGFHLEPAQRLLFTKGEPYHQGLFLWRVSAGLLLGGLFRWRGFGTAAWAHALFNLGIALGIRP